MLLLQPSEFMASASVSWASLLMAPNDMAAASNLCMIDSADSTDSRGTGAPSLISRRSRMWNSPPSAASANLA